jgi:hypothetical protein
MSDFKAKRSKILDDLKQELSKGFIQKEFTIGTHKFLMRTLTEDDEVWADSFVRTTSSVSIISSRRSPRLAASIKAIDGVSVNELFLYPDDMPAETRKNLDDNPVQKRYWLYSQVLYFLSDDTNRDFINSLWTSFESLDEDRVKASKELPNS